MARSERAHRALVTPSPPAERGELLMGLVLRHGTRRNHLPRVVVFRGRRLSCLSPEKGVENFLKPQTAVSDTHVQACAPAHHQAGAWVMRLGLRKSVFVQV